MDFPIAVVAVVGNVAFFVCVTVVLRHWMKLRHERQQGTSSREIDDLRDEVRRLREEVEPQIVELTERLDYAERLLANVPRTPQFDKPVTTPV